MLVREIEAPPPLAPPAEPSAEASTVADSAALQAPGMVSMLSMDEEDASPEARQCTAALREGKRCALPCLSTRTERTLCAQVNRCVQDLQTILKLSPSILLRMEGDTARWRWCALCSLKLAQPTATRKRKPLAHQRHGRNAVQAAEGEAGRAGAGAL